MTGEGLDFELKLLWWDFLSLEFQVIERSFFEDPSEDLLSILMLPSCYFLLYLTRELETTAYTIPKKMVLKMTICLMLIDDSISPCHIFILLMVVS